MVSKKDIALGCLQFIALIAVCVACVAANEYLDFYRFSCHMEQFRR